MRRFGQIWLSFSLVMLLLITGCTQAPPSPFDQAQQESTQRDATPAVVSDATQGSEFNKFFPSSEPGFERVYTQEKKGFAEAKLIENGKDVAMLAISDTASVPAAAAKFASSTSEIAGYPALEIGSTQTAVLVADRYQVKVLSRDPEFTAADRQAWIAKFNLDGLAQLP